MKHLLIILLSGFNAIVCFGQFNKNYSFPLDLYADVATVKATKLVNDREIMTVGYAREAGSRENVNDIVIVKTSRIDGSVIWGRTYGLDDLDEKGFGLTLSYDGRHVIVCGSAQSKESREDWNALVMKIEINTGDVVWSSQLGETKENEEFRMVERVYPDLASIGNDSPTYLLVGSASYEFKNVLYGASIHDNDGSVQWSNTYANAGTLGVVDDIAFSMVQGYADQFYICGTRKLEGKSRIFTLRINPYNGNPAYSYVVINVNNHLLNTLNQYGGSICKVDWDGSSLIGYAIACTSVEPQVGRNGFVEEAITVLILDQKGKSEYGGLYWERGFKGNRGLSVYQSTVDRRSHTLNVYTNTYNEGYDPGFVNVDILGPVNYFNKYYDSEQFEDKLPTAMVENEYGYTAKVLNKNPEEGSRFQLLQLGQDGRTDCMKEENMLYQRVESEDELILYEKTPYGRDSKRDILSRPLEVRFNGCERGRSMPFPSPQIAGETNASSKISVYPNPAIDAVNVSIEGKNVKGGKVFLMSSMGRVFYEKPVSVNNRMVTFDMTELPSGVYFIQFTDNLGNIEVKKVVKR